MNDPNRGIPHVLIFFVRQRERRRNRDAVARVHAHRIKIFNRTHDNHVILEIAHHLQLVFLPADQRTFDEDFADRTRHQCPINKTFKLFPVIGNVSTGATKCKGGPNNGGKSYNLHKIHRFFAIPNELALGSG